MRLLGLEGYLASAQNARAVVYCSISDDSIQVEVGCVLLATHPTWPKNYFTTNTTDNHITFTLIMGRYTDKWRTLSSGIIVEVKNSLNLWLPYTPSANGYIAIWIQKPKKTDSGLAPSGTNARHAKSTELMSSIGLETCDESRRSDG
ncbi:hypothetical protein K493DRAFT_379502 [Basidiobolus meristosporus CBS 931.73]|uniref:Uncharacterized protein n=1 Tax=Basidiobolus meristosporus CBS 931.73 TaxID=1314790 RepID=A0A1Y1Y016_9FUNG|nr:hypothetical protein K493DRAFT_379502 [Basidiobolus meristosporus CBS 931.73]|eukprot:ORX91056.1 hypothetical protein K493DRAFT_379502 [Basidiobolus meristosporus CBS 931.73]